jgi:hypothetical protein
VNEILIFAQWLWVFLHPAGPSCTLAFPWAAVIAAAASVISAVISASDDDANTTTQTTENALWGQLSEQQQQGLANQYIANLQGQGGTINLAGGSNTGFFNPHIASAIRGAAAGSGTSTTQGPSENAAASAFGAIGNAASDYAALEALQSARQGQQQEDTQRQQTAVAQQTTPTVEAPLGRGALGSPLVIGTGQGQQPAQNQPLTHQQQPQNNNVESPYASQAATPQQSAADRVLDDMLRRYLN